MVRVIADRSGFGCGYWSKSLFREFITVLYDVKMKTLVTLLLACCFGSAMAQSNLPLCQGNQTAWTDCFGRLTYPNGGKYVGEFKDDKKNGRGTNIYANGSKYVGEFKDNMRHGRGTETHPNGGKYVGEYKDDNKNGRGTDTYPNGDKNVGEYKDGNITQGTYFHLADNQFKGSKYVGEWKDNSINGQGTYTYANGDKYVGEFKDNKYNGQGTFTYANGEKYVGEWKDHNPSGQGILFRADGTVNKSGIWKDDVLVQSKFIDVATFTRIPSVSDSVLNAVQSRDVEQQTIVAEALDLGAYEDQCQSIGFTKKTPAFGECVLELYSRSDTAGRTTQTNASGDGSQDDTTCRNYGFTVGSSNYSQCRLQIDLAKQQAAQQQAQYEEQLAAQEKERNRRRGEAIFRLGMGMLGGGRPNNTPQLPALTPPNPTRMYNLPGGKFITCTTRGLVTQCM